MGDGLESLTCRCCHSRAVLRQTSGRTVDRRNLEIHSSVPGQYPITADHRLLFDRYALNGARS